MKCRRTRLQSNFGPCIVFAIILVVGHGCHPGSRAPAYTITEAPSVKAIDAPGSILFVGNSFTYYNSGIDEHVRRLLLESKWASDKPLTVARVSAPNRTLREHLASPELAEALSREDWDVIVFQAASYEPVRRSSRTDFHEAASALAARARAHGAEPAFLMTWPYRHRPGMMQQLAEGYIKAGNDNDALVIPVGLAWAKASAGPQSVDLYSDLTHPSLEGTYLAACVIYSTLFPSDSDFNPYTAGIEPQSARFLQQSAWQATREFLGAHGLPGKAVNSN